jgi:hypothetical protein
MSRVISSSSPSIGYEAEEREMLVSTDDITDRTMDEMINKQGEV